jgi:hypothetical protein
MSKGFAPLPDVVAHEVDTNGRVQLSEAWIAAYQATVERGS